MAIPSAIPQPMGPGTFGTPFTPYTQTEKQGPDTTTSRPIETPAHAQAMQQAAALDTEQAAISADKIQNAREQFELDKAQAAEMAQAAEQRAQLQRELSAKNERDRAAAAKYIADVDREYADQVKASSRGYWEDKSTFAKIVAAVATGFGGAAAAYTGGPNRAAQILQHAEDQDRALKQDRLRATLEKRRMAGESVEQLQREWAHGMQIIEAQHKADEEKIIAAWKKVGATIPGAVTAAQEAENATRAARAEKQEARTRAAQAQQSTTAHGEKVTTVEGVKEGSSSSKATETEAKTAFYAEQMGDELDRIRKGPKLTSEDLQKLQDTELSVQGVEKSASSGIGGALTAKAGRWLGVLPRSAIESLPKEKQIVVNSWQNAAEKITRQLTGAGMPATEETRMNRLMVPQAGDTPELIAIKEKRLTAMAAQMKALSGKPAQQALDAVRSMTNAWEGGKAASAPAAPTQAAPRKPASQAATETTPLSQMAEAVAWARANPNDPRAKLVMEKVRAEAARARNGGK